MPLIAPRVPWYVISCPNWMKTFSFMFIFIMFQNSWRTKIRKISVYYIQPRQKPHFISQISPSHKIEQKRFCMQNLRMDLSFQEKKTIWKSDTWLLRYLQNKHCTIFFETPCSIKDLGLRTGIQQNLTAKNENGTQKIDCFKTYGTLFCILTNRKWKKALMRGPP